MRQPEAQTQRLHAQRQTRRQQVRSAQETPSQERHRFTLRINTLVLFFFVCVCPVRRDKAKVCPVVPSSSPRQRGSLERLAEQRRWLPRRHDLGIPANQSNDDDVKVKSSGRVRARHLTGRF